MSSWGPVARSKEIEARDALQKATNDNIVGARVRVHYPKDAEGKIQTDRGPDARAESYLPGVRPSEPLKPLIVKLSDGSQGFYHYDQVSAI
jgi:hypothetical protein